MQELEYAPEICYTYSKFDMPTMAEVFEKYTNNGVTVASLAREYDVNITTLSRLISKHLLGHSANGKHTMVISLPSRINLESI